MQKKISASAILLIISLLGLNALYIPAASAETAEEVWQKFLQANQLWLNRRIRIFRMKPHTEELMTFMIVKLYTRLLTSYYSPGTGMVSPRKIFCKSVHLSVLL